MHKVLNKFFFTHFQIALSNCKLHFVRAHEMVQVPYQRHYNPMAIGQLQICLVCREFDSLAGITVGAQKQGGMDNSRRPVGQKQ